MSHARSAGPTRAVASAALATGLALALLISVAPAAHAIVEVRLAEPGSGATITQSTPVRVRVESRLLEEVDWVEARLVRQGETVGAPTRLSYQEGDRSGGTSTWTTTWNPAQGWAGGGGRLPNGAYRLQARARSTGLASGEASAWQGHGVTVSLPPSAPGLEAQVTGDGQSVSLQWSTAGAPDFAFYRLERAPAGGSFEALTQITQRQDTAHTDEPGSPGTWRYRVTTARGDGAGGFTTAASGVVSVDIASPEPTPTPTPTSRSGLRPDDPQGGDAQESGSGDGQGSGSGDGQGDSGDGQSDSGDGQGGSGDDSGDGQGGSGDGQGDGTGSGTGGGSGDGGSSLPGLQGGGAAPPESTQSSVPDLQDDGSGASAPSQPEPQAQVPSDSSTFSRQLPYEQQGDAPAPRTPGGATGQGGSGSAPGGPTDEEVARAAGTDAAVITVGGRQVLLERVLPPMAGGLLLFVVAGHLLRLRRRLG